LLLLLLLLLLPSKMNSIVRALPGCTSSRFSLKRPPNLRSQ
jgi:hypothetical protein